MRLVCPACRKTHLLATNDATITDETGHSRAALVACDRCGCDLSHLIGLLRAATVLTSQARGAMRRREWEAGLARAIEAWDLTHAEQSAAVACLAAAALGDAAALEHWRRRWRSEASSR